MKLLIVCALLPLAMCLPTVDVEDKIKGDIQFLLEKFVSSDLTHKACQTECEKYVTGDIELNTALVCPLTCMALQKELEKVVTPHNSKRSFFLPHLNITSMLDLEKFKTDMQMLVDLVGSDPLEQQCENGCHHLFKTPDNFMHYLCQPVCKGFQATVQKLHIHRDPVTTVPLPTTV